MPTSGSILPSLLLLALTAEAAASSSVSATAAAFIAPSPSLSLRLRFSSSSSDGNGATIVVASSSSTGAAVASSSSSSSAPQSQPSILGGTGQFEAWFASLPGAASSDLVRHASFQGGQLRGIEFINPSTDAVAAKDLKDVLTVPRPCVLRAPYGERKGEAGWDWDRDLSVSLLKECAKGEKSAYYGYCSLLTRGVDFSSVAPSSPPPTAPDALRHWTPSQKARLESSDAGRKLLQTDSDQTSLWHDKYDSLPISDRNDFNRDQFLWAMEAVHSRAFRGDFGMLQSGAGGKFRAAASLLMPVSAAAIGLNYMLDPLSGESEALFVPLALLALAPFLLNRIAESRGTKDAVLLPYIDSANHVQEADSVIEFDPVKDVFTLSLGRRCLVKERDDSDEGKERAQVCISYGIKKDPELMLNYGFLRGVRAAAAWEGGEEMVDTVSSESDEQVATREEQRRRLAEAFVGRNP